MREFLTVLQIDHLPAWTISRTRRIIMVASRVELRIVSVRRPDDFGAADHRGRIGVAVIKEHQVPDGHLSHKVPGLIVPDSIPAGGLPRRAAEIVDGKDLRL